MDISVIAAILSVIALALAVYNAYITPKIIANEADNILNTIDNQLKETLQPMQHVISRTMSNMGEKGISAIQQRTLDKNLALDVINLQDPLIQQALELFPNVKQYINKNPNLILELIPRIQKLRQIDGLNLPDIIKPGNNKTDDLDPRFRY